MEYAPAKRHRRWVRAIIVTVVTSALLMLGLAYIVNSGKRGPHPISAAQNLRSIGWALHIYANDNGGVCPGDVRSLADLVDKREFVHPNSGHRPPFCDFYYVADLPIYDGAIVPHDWILAFGDPAYNSGRGAHILFADAHVEFFKEPRFSQLLSDFKREYEETCGVPPTIVPPDLPP